ncbi:MAG: DUF2383 domain-containing protein [Planctomycetota bacterium]
MTRKDLGPRTIEALEELARADFEEAMALERAAAGCASTGVTGHLRALARQRRELARELRTHFEEGGVDAPATRGLLETLRQVWLDLKRVVQRGDPQRVIEEVLGSEGELERAYRDALHETAGSPLNALLMAHLRRIRADEQTLRTILATVGG